MCLSWWRILDLAFSRKISIASLIRFLQPNLTAWGWDCPSVDRSSKHTTAAFGPSQTLHMGQYFAYLCRLPGRPAAPHLIEPVHLAPIKALLTDRCRLGSLFKQTERRQN